MLDFRPVTIEDKAVAEAYTFPYGENSCQQSYTGMYCTSPKYGDCIAESGGFLFSLRKGKSIPGQWHCLFPIGDTSDRTALLKALNELLDTAHAAGARVVFNTLMARSDELLHELMPGRFVSEDARDAYEYIHTWEKLGELPGHEMSSKRHDVASFFHKYGERCEIRVMNTEDIPAVREFQKEWLESQRSESDYAQLVCEDVGIQKGLSSFEELGLSGIIVLMDGRIAGYAYGAPLSADCYDVLIEKGDRRFTDIYKVLNRDLVRLCAVGYAYINREEDLGIDGLRTAKLSYKPDILLVKRIATEVGNI